MFIFKVLKLSYELSQLLLNAFNDQNYCIETKFYLKKRCISELKLLPRVTLLHVFFHPEIIWNFSIESDFAAPTIFSDFSSLAKTKRAIDNEAIISYENLRNLIN